MHRLKRVINWKIFSLYGLGNILGAGIYILVGEVANVAGNGLVWSFVIAGVIAAFTALTYSAFASAYPVSAGAAVYAQKAFGTRWLSSLIGLSLAFTGVVSASALLRGFNRYFQELLSATGITSGLIPGFVVITTLALVLGAFALKGIKESAALIVILTLLEAGGLILIIVVASIFGDFNSAISTSMQSIPGFESPTIMLGALLAFYAFIGFEDMVNIAEEVKQPHTSIRKGIITALIGAGILYIY